MENQKASDGWSYVHSLDAELKDYQLMLDGIRNLAAMQEDKSLNDLVDLLNMRINSTRKSIMSKLIASGSVKMYIGSIEDYEPPIGTFL